MNTKKKIKVLVVGASGATGRLLVAQLLDRGVTVKAIVRSAKRFSENVPERDGLTLIEASVLNLTDDEMAHHVEGCGAVASCLGHNLSLKGLYGKPRLLVTDATRRLCEAVKANGRNGPVRFVLMNTAGNRNRDLQEKISFGQRLVVGLIRLLLPPHGDNERAADYLRCVVGQNDESIEWAAVRPDDLVDETDVSAYDVHRSPIRDTIFNAGKTSRINLAHFMAELITVDGTWNKWKGEMPVVYNRETR